MRGGTRFDGWVPIRVYWEHARPVVDWCYLGERAFTEPFFADTIQRCLRQPFNLLFRHQTPMEALVEWQRVQPGIPPTGFIFHMSRCGSTLIARMLASLAQHVVISEAGPIDAILRGGDPCHDEDERVAWLQWMVSALGQRRRGGETRLFIKLDSWSVMRLPLIARAFPSVPWIFVHRDPADVLASHQRQRGPQMVPALVDPALFQIDRAAAIEMRPEAYTARVLSRICGTALDALRTGAGLAVAYDQLPDAVWSSLPEYWGFTLNAADREAMMQAARFDAKNPSLVFEPRLSVVS